MDFYLRFNRLDLFSFKKLPNYPKDVEDCVLKQLNSESFPVMTYALSLIFYDLKIDY